MWTWSNNKQFYEKNLVEEKPVKLEIKFTC